jgi:hypothetical protein
MGPTFGFDIWQNFDVFTNKKQLFGVLSKFVGFHTKKYFF